VAAGSILGTVMLGLWGRAIPYRCLIFPSLAGMGIALALMVVLPWFWPICVLSALLGLSYPGFDVSFTTVLQTSTPNEVRGRVFATMETAIEGTAVVTRSALALATTVAGTGLVIFLSAVSLVLLAGYGLSRSRAIAALSASSASGTLV